MCLIKLSAIIAKDLSFKFESHTNLSLKYLIFAMSVQNQASFAKCYSKLLFLFDLVQREISLYHRF